MEFDKSLPIRNWLKYTSVCWLVIAPVYALHVYVYYLGAGRGPSLFEAVLISLQDVVIWLLLGPLLAWLYPRIDPDLPVQHRAWRYAATVFAASILHVAIDGFANTVFVPFRGYTLGFFEFWLHVGFAKLLPNALIASVLMLSLALYDRRRAGSARLAEASERVETPPPEDPADRLLVREQRAVVSIPYADIDYIESAGNYCCIHHAGRTQIVRHTLARLDAALPKPAFLRIHRRTIVRFDRILEFRLASHGDGEILLSGDTRLRVSRRYRGPLDAAFAGAAASS